MEGKYIIVSVTEKCILSVYGTILWVEESRNDKLIRDHAQWYENIDDALELVETYNNGLGAAVWQVVLYDDIIKRLPI